MCEKLKMGDSATSLYHVTNGCYRKYTLMKTPDSIKKQQKRSAISEGEDGASRELR